MIKNLPAKLEVWVQSLGQEDPLKKEMATHYGISCLKDPKVRGAWQAIVLGVVKSQTPLSDWTTTAAVVECGIFSCGLGNLVSQPGIELEAPALEAQSPSHWTTKKVPAIFF